MFNKAFFSLLFVICVCFYALVHAGSAYAQDAGDSNSGNANYDESTEDISADTVDPVVPDDHRGIDFEFGVGYANEFTFPVYGGVNFRISDFYRTGVELKLSLFFELMFSASWENIFILYSGDTISFSLWVGAGFLTTEGYTIRFDGSYDDDQYKDRSISGVEFPVTLALDWHFCDSTSLRLRFDWNNFVVLEDKSETEHKKPPRYDKSYDFLIAFVMHF